jgi:hypothetical protein
MARHILRHDSRRKHTVYFIEAPAVGVMKIGVTGDLGRRFKVMSDGSPTPLVVVCSFAGTARQESALHTRFLASRSHGEWFRISDEMRALVDRINNSTPTERGALFRSMRARRLPSLRPRKARAS